MKIVILGGVAAGAKAAAKAKRLLPDAEIDLYTDDTHVSYSSCGLPYYIEGNFEDYQMLLVRSPEEFEQKGIHIHLKSKAIKILPNSKQVLIENLEDNNSYLVKYDKLIIAIGARPIIPDIKNVNLPNIFTLRKIEDGINIKQMALKSNKVVVVGGGYIGMELLEAFVRQNLDVTLIENSKHVMPSLDDEISELIETQLESINDGRFKILTSELVTEFCGDLDGVKAVYTNSGKCIDADFVVLCVGVRPNSELAQDAGIELGETGAIKVNEKMETNIPDIYACGDCVEATLVIDGSKIWMPLGSTANKEGRTAAMNASGLEDKFYGVLGSAVTRCLNLTISMTGLTEKKAKSLGYKTISTIITKYDKVGYMPDVNNITLKLVADSKTGLILGAQAVGAGDADKRINTLTSAILAHMTVDEFYKNDLTYAPPYSPTIDPLLNAAQILSGKIKKVKH